MRVDEDQPWQPRYLVQPLWNFINACIFEYGIAMYDLDLGEALREKKGFSPEMKANIRRTLAKVRKQVTKDYVVHPALSLVTGSFLTTLAANATANLVRNVWSHSIIMCGHFPEGVETFEQPALDPGETKAQWYLRQMLGSANISGSKFMHLMSGNLSHQIEHHLFPDLPSNRYGEMSPKVRGALRALRADLQRPPAARSRWPAPGTGCCGSRCPTAGWPRPTAATWSPSCVELARMARSGADAVAVASPRPAACRRTPRSARLRRGSRRRRRRWFITVCSRAAASLDELTGSGG